MYRNPNCQRRDDRLRCERFKVIAYFFHQRIVDAVTGLAPAAGPVTHR